MVYRIEYSRDAARTLGRMPRNTAETVRSKVRALAADPLAPNNNVKKLVGRPGYRLRVGDWRVIYELQDTVRIIDVIQIAPRGGAYR